LTNIGDSRIANLDATVSSRAATTDARFEYLDVSVASRAATADARFSNLDAAVTSRLAASAIPARFADLLIDTDGNVTTSNPATQVQVTSALTEVRAP